MDFIIHKTLENASADAEAFALAVNELLEKRAAATAVPTDATTVVSVVGVGIS